MRISDWSSDVFSSDLLTIDMAGRARFGPDVQWVEEPDFHVDAARPAAFYDAIRCYWPSLPDGALSPASAGIRPKLGGAAEPSTDFLIAGTHNNGQPGIINLFGIESPRQQAHIAI